MIAKGDMECLILDFVAEMQKVRDECAATPQWLRPFVQLIEVLGFGDHFVETFFDKNKPNFDQPLMQFSQQSYAQHFENSLQNHFAAYYSEWQSKVASSSFAEQINQIHSLYTREIGFVEQIYPQSAQTV